MPTEETLALERAQQADPFLALIEKVIENKAVDADKLKVLVDLQIQLEDRHAEKLFNAAMIAARKEVQGIGWDRTNPHTKSNYASYPKIDEKIRPIMDRHGFALTFGAEPTDHAALMIMYADVMHEGGHTRRYTLPMPIDNKGPQGGSGVMTGPQAVGSGTSYGMRYLVKMIFNISMLAEQDDNDGNQIRATINAQQKKTIETLTKGWDDWRKNKLLENYSIESLDDLPASKFNNAVSKINASNRVASEQSKDATIDQNQEATLLSLMEEIGGPCKKEFLKANKILFVSELPVSQYKAAVMALEAQRRK